MIPKKIHYCWFGRGQMPELAIKCIDSWKKHLPNYEIIEWNEDNFDINSNKYVKEAYEAKKYAFVSDYVRLYALYNHGGIYMDTDIEVLQPLDKFLEHKLFMGNEREDIIQTGLIGSEKEMEIIKDMMYYYSDKRFILENGRLNTLPNPKIITPIIIRRYDWKEKDELQVLEKDVVIYPIEYFCAKSFETGQLHITNNTYTVHHFSGSWHTKSDKIKRNIIRLLGPKNTRVLSSLKKKMLPE